MKTTKISHPQLVNLLKKLGETPTELVVWYRSNAKVPKSINEKFSKGVIKYCQGIYQVNFDKDPSVIRQLIADGFSPENYFKTRSDSPRQAWQVKIPGTCLIRHPDTKKYYVQVRPIKELGKTQYRNLNGGHWLKEDEIKQYFDKTRFEKNGNNGDKKVYIVYFALAIENIQRIKYQDKVYEIK